MLVVSRERGWKTVPSWLAKERMGTWVGSSIFCLLGVMEPKECQLGRRLTFPNTRMCSRCADRLKRWGRRRQVEGIAFNSLSLDAREGAGKDN